MTENVLHDYIAGGIGGSVGILVGHPFDTTKVQLQTQLHGTQYKGISDAVTSINKQGWAGGLFRGLSSPLLSYSVVNAVFFGVYGNTLQYIEPNKSKRKSSFWNIYLAGCVGGTAQLVPVIPVDYVKVVLQSQIPHDSKQPKGSSLNKLYFKGPMQCAAHIIRNQGIKGLYKGTGGMILRDVPSFGIYTLTYESLSDLMKVKGWTDSKGFFADFIAGGCAGSLTWFSIMPFDVIKSRYQADFKNEFTSAWDCGVKSYREEGVRVFYRGTLVTCARAFPVSAVTFVVYSQIMQYFEKH